MQEKYDILLNAELLSNTHNASVMFFKKTDNEICWWTNCVFTLKDIKLYDVKYRSFHLYDKPTLKASIPWKTFASGDAIYLPGPNEITSDTTAVVFVFRNIKYCVVVTKQDSRYLWKVAGMQIAADKIIMPMPTTTQLLE